MKWGTEERRLLAYLLLLLASVPVAFLGVGAASAPSREILGLLGGVATVLALVTAVLALVRFYTGRSAVFLYIGTGFLATAFLDGYHTLVAAPFLPTPGIGAPEDLPAWTWLASRLFLSLFLFMSWLAWYMDHRAMGEAEGPSTEPKEGQGSVYLTAALLTALTFGFFTLTPLTDPYIQGARLSRPVELIPAALFLMAALGYLWKGGWRTEPFEHWLIFALLLGAVTHGGVTVFAQSTYDGAMFTGQMLQIAGYGCVMVGLLASVFTAFKEQDRTARVITETNDALAREVETRRRAEQVLQESEERLQDFLDNANDLIQITDAEGRITYANQAWRRTLGYEKSDLEVLQLFSLVHPHSAETLREVFDSVLSGTPKSGFQVVLRRADGEPVALSGSMNPRMRNGEAVATRTIFRNVTEQVRAEQELARSRANLKALFESTGDAIWSVDQDHRLVTFNSAFSLTVEALTGRAPRPGDGVPEIVAAGQVQWFRNSYDRALAGNRFSATREERLDGVLRSYELFFHPYETVEGMAGVVVFSKDVTRRRQVEIELRRAKSEAEEANEAKSHFMASMSHELRTPLNSVIGFANILLKSHPKPEEGRDREREFLERIVANGNHLLSLINQILDLAKIESGKLELEVEQVDLRELVPLVVRQLEGQVQERPVELRYHWDVAPQPITTDPGKLRQVLINLVGNAIKFTEEGSVTVEVESDPETGTPRRIRVQDTGIGIAGQRLEKIFEAFRQADGSTTRRFGGTGLGLTISRSLCHLMGYGISVASVEGEGSTFTVDLEGGTTQPRGRNGRGVSYGRRGHEGLSTSAAEVPDGSAEAESRTVLLISHRVEFRHILGEYLEDLGYVVETEPRGDEGLERLRQGGIATAVVEFLMPEMSGWELLEHLRWGEGGEATRFLLTGLPGGPAGIDAAVQLDLVPHDVEDDAILRAIRRNTGDQPPGRLLVVEHDQHSRSELHRSLREADFVVHSVPSGPAALEFLRRVEVDVIVLDLRTPSLEGFELVDALAEASRERGGMGAGPIVVLTREPTSDDLRVRLRRMAAGRPEGPGIESSQLPQSLGRALEAGRAKPSGYGPSG